GLGVAQPLGLGGGLPAQVAQEQVRQVQRPVAGFVRTGHGVLLPGSGALARFYQGTPAKGRLARRPARGRAAQRFSFSSGSPLASTAPAATSTMRLGSRYFRATPCTSAGVTPCTPLRYSSR